MPHAKPSAKGFKKAQKRAVKKYQVAVQKYGTHQVNARGNEVHVKYPRPWRIRESMMPSQRLKGKKIGGAPATKVR